MREALDGPELSNPFRDADYLNAMQRILADGPAVKADERSATPTSRMKPLVVYTAIFGGRDNLQEPTAVEPGIEYVCFTDNPRLKSATWRIAWP